MPILTDGFSTTINLTGAGTTFIEKTVTPPAVDGGGKNDITGMRNITYRTAVPKKLKTLDKMTLKVYYDPAFYNTTIAQINVLQQIQITFPDTHTVTIWGWLNKFTPDALEEGKEPEATIEIEIGNVNSSFAEVAPAYA